jgi:hypothetical protein
LTDDVCCDQQRNKKHRTNARFSAIEGVDGEDEEVRLSTQVSAAMPPTRICMSSTPIAFAWHRPPSPPFLPSFPSNAGSALFNPQPNSTILNPSQEATAAMDIGTGGMAVSGVGHEPPPVDYYRASYAFLVGQGNHQQAAADMYRLVQRLDLAAAYEDSLPRLHRKVEALAAVHNALCVIRAQQQGGGGRGGGGIFPFFHFMHEDRHFNNSGGGQQQQQQQQQGQRGQQQRTRKRMSAITLQRVEQELAYAVAAREYLEATQGTSAPPLRPLGLAPVPALPPGAHPPAAAAGGDDDARRARAAAAQAGTAAACLCRVGLYESAANLLKAFGLPMTPVVRSLARAYASLRSRRGGDVAMVREDGPAWDVGDPVEEGEESKEAARRAAFLRLAAVEARVAAEGGDAEAVGLERAAAGGAEAAGWLLKDVVQAYDWAHAFALHAEAARYLLAADSFAPLPRWLTAAFTRGGWWTGLVCVCVYVSQFSFSIFTSSSFLTRKASRTNTNTPTPTPGVEARLLKPSSKRRATVAEYTDQQGVKRVGGAAAGGAFLAMHVDKAVYLLQQGNNRGDGVLREALHLLVAALGYAKVRRRGRRGRRIYLVLCVWGGRGTAAWGVCDASSSIYSAALSLTNQTDPHTFTPSPHHNEQQDMVDTAVEQLHRASSTSTSNNNDGGGSSKQVCLPRTQIAALVLRTREALAAAQAASGSSSSSGSSSGSHISNLVAAAEEGIATLGKVFKVYDGNVGDAEASLGLSQAVAAAVAPTAAAAAGAGGGFGGFGGGGGGGFAFGGGGSGGFGAPSAQGSGFRF